MTKNRPFIVYKILSTVAVNGTSTLFFDYVHTKNEELQAYSSLSSVTPIKVEKILEVEESDEALIEIISKFSEELHEDVYDYEVNGLDSDKDD